jgi:hypothetical protein
MKQLSKNEQEIVKLKIDYFIQCTNYLSEQYGIDRHIDKVLVEKVFRRLKDRVNINSVGENYIWSYITYLFYDNLHKRKFENFKWSWITSSKAFTDWVDKPLDWYDGYGRWLLDSLLKRPKTSLNINPMATEEIFRKKHLNTVKGFATCIENTSLVDPKSKYCKMCFKKLDCIELLKANNPELYNYRYVRHK